MKLGIIKKAMSKKTRLTEAIKLNPFFGVPSFIEHLLHPGNYVKSIKFVKD